MNDFSPSETIGRHLYKEVKSLLLAGLSRGEWMPGEVIPSEKPLSVHFGVSIGTLRKAIDELVAENILIRHQGRGTFVASHSRNQHFFNFFNVVRHDGKKSYPKVELVSFSKCKADPLTCKKLEISTKAKIFQFTNVLSLNDEACIVDVIALPELHFAGLTEQLLRNRNTTLYTFYQEAFGINVIRTEEHIRATVASAELGKWLGVEIGMPLLQIRRTVFSYNNQPIEWRLSYVNTEHYEYLARSAQ